MLKLNLLKKLVWFKKAIKHNPYLLLYFIVYGIISFMLLYGVYYLIDLIYEPSMINIISKNLLIIGVFIPMELILLVLISIFKVIIDRINKKYGAILRFKLIMIFLVMNILPLILIIYLSYRTIGFTLDMFINKETIVALDNSLNLMKANINKYKKSMDKYNEYILKHNKLSYDYFNQKIIFSSDITNLINSFELDYFSVFDSKFQEINLNNKFKISVEDIFHLYKLNNKNIFSTYNLKNDSIVKLSGYRLTNNNKYYILSGKKLYKFSPKKTLNLIKTIRNLKRLEILKPSVKNSIFFLFIYIFVPISSIGILYIYKKVGNIFTPIGQMVKATKDVSQENFKDIKITDKGKDEIRILATAFIRMIKELEMNRIIIKRNAKIDAWRDSAVRFAHEIKNPLTPIKLAVEKIENNLQKKDFELYASLNDSFNLVYYELNSIKDYLFDFSEFTKAQNIKKSKININDIFLNISTFISHYPNIKYSLDIENYLKDLLLDKKKFEQILKNLILNAVDAINDKIKLKKRKFIGKITIKVTKVEKDNNIFCNMQIKDNGIGIKDIDKDKIFIPQFTTKKKGSGLGLAIIEQIVSAHNGEIYFDSKENLGTVFTIRIPI